MQSPISESESLAARVERLEKQYRWLNTEIATERLVLVDSDGTTRGTLRMTEGVPSLILYDTGGNVRAILRVSDEGPALHLLNPKTGAAFELRVNESGPDLSLFDRNGKQRLALNVLGSPLDEAGSPSLLMREPDGTAAVVVTSPEGRGNINLSDASKHNTEIGLHVDRNGPILVCMNEGKMLWSAP